MIALGHRITIYDALYIALAATKGLPLLALNNNQGEVAREVGVNVITPL